MVAAARLALVFACAWMVTPVAAQNDGRSETNEYYGDPNEGYFGDPSGGYHGMPLLDRSDELRSYRPARASDSPFLAVEQDQVVELDRSFAGD